MESGRGLLSTTGWVCRVVVDTVTVGSQHLETFQKAYFKYSIGLTILNPIEWHEPANPSLIHCKSVTSWRFVCPDGCFSSQSYTCFQSLQMVWDGWEAKLLHMHP